MLFPKYHGCIISFFVLFSLFLSIQAQEMFEGYTFYASGTKAYLYDDEDLIHTWTSDYSVMSNAHLLKDSSVFFPGRNPGQWSGGAQQGGQLQIIQWDGEITWDYQYSSSTYCPHHDSEPIYKTNDPNEVPNIMVICYEKVSGVNGNSDKLVEFKPTGLRSAEIVWEWHASDHKTSSGNDNPELLSTSAGGSGDWTHINNVSYNMELDQLVIGVKSFYEVMIIDHSTTTQEAAGSTGGTYGKGGDILYRWGKSSNYGISGNSYLSGFHCGRWIPKTFPGTNLEVPGGGNIILVHNGDREVVEIQPPGNGDGIYPRGTGEPFGPDEPVWTKSVSNITDHQGSVQRLPNGNTLVCAMSRGIYEYAPDGSEVWSKDASCNKATRYAYTYFDEQTDDKGKLNTVQQGLPVRIYSSPVTSNIHISFGDVSSNAEVSIFSMNGKDVFSQSVNRNNVIWHTKNQAQGVYAVIVRAEGNLHTQYVNVMY